MASANRLRVFRDKPGRAQVSPQAYRVIRSWKSWLKGFRLARLASTWADPSTSRRIFRPAEYRSRSSMSHVSDRNRREVYSRFAFCSDTYPGFLSLKANLDLFVALQDTVDHCPGRTQMGFGIE